MSHSKKDRLFPIKLQAVSDDELAKIVASALRHDFGDSASAIKRIGQLTNANVPINVPLKSLNERQRWFLLLLRRKKTACAEDIAEHFGVALKTARRDIEALKSAKKIKFFGSKKTGSYEIIDT